MSHKRLLELLRRHADQYVSGAEMSEALGVSRTAIWKQIKKLEAAGYEFEASTKRGYRLLFEPDTLSKELLQAAAGQSRYAQSVHVFDELDSTQNKARALAEEGAVEGTLVIAERQSSGRGRMGRAWTSPSGKGIWMSFVLRPSVPIHCAPQLTLLTAVVLCRSLKRMTGLPIGIKWPNDLLINGKKISGILLESAAEDERLKYIISGIGIGVNLSDADYPDEVLSKATSLRIEAGRSFKRAELIADFFKEWEQMYELFQREGFSPIIALWESLSVSLGKPVALTTPHGVLYGTPVGLEESGAIVIRREDGSYESIFSAEMGEPLGRV